MRRGSPPCMPPMIDHDNPPSSPRRLAGKAAISSYFSDICGRDVVHLIENAIAAGNRLAFTKAALMRTAPRCFARRCSISRAERSRSRPSFRPGTARPRSPPNRVRRQSFTWNLPGTSPGTRPRTAGSSYRRPEDLKQVPGEEKMKVPEKLITAVLAATLMARPFHCRLQPRPLGAGAPVAGVAAVGMGRLRRWACRRRADRRRTGGAILRWLLRHTTPAITAATAAATMPRLTMLTRRARLITVALGAVALTGGIGVTGTAGTTGNSRPQ